MIRTTTKERETEREIEQELRVRVRVGEGDVDDAVSLWFLSQRSAPPRSRHALIAGYECAPSRF